MSINHINANSKKEFQLFLWFFMGYAMCYLITLLGDYFSITISYWISELDQEVSFVIPAQDLIEIFLMGPVFSVITWKVFKSIFLDEQILLKEKLSTKWITALEVIFFVSVCTMCLGNAIHKVVNDLNRRAFDVTKILSDPLYADLYYAIYFWDEIFGHMALAVPLMILMSMFMGGLLFSPPSRDLKWFEWLFITLVGIGYGIVWFYGFAEGQATFVLLLINVGLVLFIVATKFKKKKCIRDHPFVWVVLIEALIFITCSIIWGLITGLKPYYPFFKQPGEELWIKLKF
ncbi:hypothetical protein ES703_51139 [subsurface metagenome]